MRKRRVCLLLIAIAVLVGVLAVIFGPEREPEYGGKKLSEWVESYDVPGMIDRIQSYSYDSEQSDADKAVCGIGTNGIPYLLKWMGYETPTWKHQFQLAVYRVFGKTTRSWRLHDNALRGDGSACALMALGPKAEGAVSNLAQMLNGPTTRAPSQRALFALAGLGKTGLPALVTVLTNQQWTPGFRILVIDRVGALGSDAYPAIPLLQQLLREPDKKMRFFVTNALQKIDPEALQSKGAPAFQGRGADGVNALRPQVGNVACSGLHQIGQRACCWRDAEATILRAADCCCRARGGVGGGV